MAVIICTKCGKYVSDKSSKCYSCDYPVESIQKEINAFGKNMLGRKVQTGGLIRLHASKTDVVDPLANSTQVSILKKDEVKPNVSIDQDPPIEILEKDYLDKTILDKKDQGSNGKVEEISVDVQSKIDYLFEGQDILLEVLPPEYGRFDSGEGYIVYFTVKNMTDKKMSISVEDGFIITKGGEQRENDFWLSGFDLRNTSILGNSFKRGGMIYLLNHIDSISNVHMFGLTVEDRTSHKIYCSIFKQYESSKWSLESLEIKQIDNRDNHKSIARKLKGRIEKIDKFENELNLRLDHISVQVSKSFDNIVIFGEVIQTGELNHNLKWIKVSAVFYTDDYEILGTQDSIVYLKDFMGFGVFELSIYDENIANEVENIRLFITKQ